MEQLETLSGIYKALGDPTRLKLVKLLSGQPVMFCNGQCNGENFLCVGSLAKQLGVTQSAVSQHLRILRQAGLVRGERQGSFMHYSLNHEGLKQYRELVTHIMGDGF